VEAHGPRPIELGLSLVEPLLTLKPPICFILVEPVLAMASAVDPTMGMTMPTPYKPKLAIIGIGKIAADQHLPRIAETGLFKLVGVVSQRGIAVPGVPTFRSQLELLARVTDVEAIVNCTPPRVRHDLAVEALRAGKHLLIEKPPTASIAELNHMKYVAKDSNRTLFAAWHSRFNAGVDRARDLLRTKIARDVEIIWKEDVRRWHPGQDWVFEPGGFGVFDPGINALSIITEIMPYQLFVESADLHFASNRATPIAVDLKLRGPAQSGLTSMTCALDWRQEGEQIWTITIRLQDGDVLQLTHGGTRLLVNGKLLVSEPDNEYRRIYQRFHSFITSGLSDADGRPLELVADAFLVGRRHTLEPFEW
jgi:D-galactose 1-dehydrogenase